MLGSAGFRGKERPKERLPGRVAATGCYPSKQGVAVDPCWQVVTRVVAVVI